MFLILLVPYKSILVFTVSQQSAPAYSDLLLLNPPPFFLFFFFAKQESLKGFPNLTSERDLANGIGVMIGSIPLSQIGQAVVLQSVHALEKRLAEICVQDVKLTRESTRVGLEILFQILLIIQRELLEVICRYVDELFGRLPRDTRFQALGILKDTLATDCEPGRRNQLLNWYLALVEGCSS